MPTYDYKCDACGHTFEQWQSFSEETLKKCPACKKNKLQRLFGGGAAIIFKGSGFYETDYRKESYKQGEKAEKDAAKPATDAKSDAAPAASSDSAASPPPPPPPAASNGGSKPTKSGKAKKTE